MITLDTKLENIRGISSKFIAKFKKLNIATVKDLLWHFPTRYEDFSRTVSIAELEAGQMATVRGIIQNVALRRSWRRNMFIVEASIADDTGEIRAIWFNQPFMARVLRTGMTANFAGKIVFSDEDLCLSNPTHEIAHTSGEVKHTAGLIPVYPETKGLTSKGIRFLVKPLLKVLPTLQDFIPDDVLKELGMPDLKTALNWVHFPEKLELAEKAKQRFSFEDIFLLQLHNVKLRAELAKEKAMPLAVSKKERDEIFKTIPFTLTGAQSRALEDVLIDIAKPQPMNRLLQGDVGSGKTIVAAIAALVATRNAKQSAFMAPTEVLARQHYKTITKIFGDADVAVALLTGSEARSFYGKELESSRKKTDLVQEIEEGKIHIVIGTHSLINGIAFQDLGLAIVDEQHRFGVEQRAALIKQDKTKKKEASTIHFLSMSATPIPRTLSLALFGDLDLSVIDELPAGRKPIVTKIVDPLNRQKAYDFIRKEIKAGRQAFFIYPRIEKADIEVGQKNLWSDVKAVTEGYEKLSKEIFPEFTVGMLHGKLKAKEKEAVMAGFSENKTSILVSTSVVEVGVDVPNAAIMVIEGADRFGLSQLYQFRGRVGRGEHQSYCLLFTDSEAESVQKRLQALIDAKNGFELAEYDLKFRGPGQFLGDKQTGLPDIAMDALNNIELIKNARLIASRIIDKNPTLSKHPALQTRVEQLQQKVHLE